MKEQEKKGIATSMENRAGGWRGNGGCLKKIKKSDCPRHWQLFSDLLSAGPCSGHPFPECECSRQPAFCSAFAPVTLTMPGANGFILYKSSTVCFFHGFLITDHVQCMIQLQIVRVCIHG